MYDARKYLWCGDFLFPIVSVILFHLKIRKAVRICASKVIPDGLHAPPKSIIIIVSDTDSAYKLA